MLFDVRVIAFDARAEDSVSGLMQVFKLDRTTAEDLVRKLPRVIKRGVPMQTAERLTQVLAHLGAQTEIVISGPLATSTPQDPDKARAADPRRADTGRSRTYVSEERVTLGLPAPHPSALGSALAQTPANGNATRLSQTGSSHARQSGSSIARVSLVSAAVQARPSFSEESALPSQGGSRTAAIGRVESPASPVAGRGADAPRAARRSSPGAYHEAAAQHSRPSATSGAERRSRLSSSEAEHSVAVTPLSSLSASTQLVEAKKLELEGTGALTTKADALTALMLASLSLATFGMLPVVLLGYLLYDLVKRWSTVRAVQSSAVPLGAQQLPELHACVKHLALRLQLKLPTRVFVSTAAHGTPITVVFRGETTLLLPAETLADQLERGSGDVVSFMLAHELACLALGYHGRVPAFLAWIWPAVHKLQVLSADAVAAELMADRSLAQSALLTMLVGRRLSLLLDVNELHRQATQHEQQELYYAPALEGQSEFLLARIHHMRRRGAA